MSAKDHILGKAIHGILVSKDIETPLRLNQKPKYVLEHPEELSSEQQIQMNVYDMMSALGLDLSDDSLKDTPRRVAKMYCHEVFEGLNYDNFPKCTTIENKMGYDEMIIVKDIVVRSCCEHHLQAIYGRAHIAYIPDKLVIGLSKFARVVDFFASRPQVQERLTEQVYAALSYILGTENVAVVIEADHFCMRMRGVEDACSSTTTSKMCGNFRTNSDARKEFLSLIGK